MALEKISGAASGAVAGAKIGSVIPGVGTAIGSVVGGLAGLFGSKKTSSVPARKPIDIAKLVEDARANAQQNLSRSLELEASYLPEQAAFRRAANTGLATRAAQVGSAGYLDALMKGLGEATKFLPEGSAGRAILDEAKLGATLSPDVQAEVAKSALEGASSAGIAGSSAGAGRVARDIGLSAAALRERRLAAALGVENDAASRMLAGEQLRGSEVARLGQLSLSTALPEAGLSAGTLADLAIAESNAANQYAVSSAAAKNASTQSRNQMLQNLFGQAGAVADSGMLDGLFKTSTPMTGSELLAAVPSSSVQSGSSVPYYLRKPV